MPRKTIKIITFNLPKSAAVKLKLIMKTLLGKPIDVVVGEDIIEEFETSVREIDKWLKEHRPFMANIKGE